MLALMMATLSGTMYIYQGQELGMVNFPLEWDISEYKDIDSSNYYNMVFERTQGNSKALLDAKIGLQHLARDHARVPMQWDSSINAGFSTGKPWMRVNDDYPSCNAEQQGSDPKSTLAYWRKMLALRNEYADLFVYGDFDLLDRDDQHLFAFTKTWRDKKALTVCNFSDGPQNFTFPGKVSGKLLVGTVAGADGQLLRPYEGRVYLL